MLPDEKTPLLQGHLLEGLVPWNVVPWGRGRLSVCTGSGVRGLSWRSPAFQTHTDTRVGCSHRWCLSEVVVCGEGCAAHQWIWGGQHREDGWAPFEIFPAAFRQRALCQILLKLVIKSFKCLSKVYTFCFFITHIAPTGVRTPGDVEWAPPALREHTLRPHGHPVPVCPQRAGPRPA